MHGQGETVHVPFPFDKEDFKGGEYNSREAVLCTKLSGLWFKVSLFLTLF